MPMIRHRKIVIYTTIGVYDDNTGDMIVDHTECESRTDNGTLTEARGFKRMAGELIQVVAVRSTQALDHIVEVEKDRGN